MSWKAYPQKMVASKNCIAAAVCAKNGKVWGVDGAYLKKLSTSEGKKLAEIITGGKAGTAFSLAGNAFFNLRVMDKELMGKEKKNGKVGCSAMITKKAIVIGVYDEDKNQSPGNCAKTVGEMGDFLTKKGY